MLGTCSDAQLFTALLRCAEHEGSDLLSFSHLLTLFAFEGCLSRHREASYAGVTGSSEQVPELARDCVHETGVYHPYGNTWVVTSETFMLAGMVISQQPC